MDALEVVKEVETAVGVSDWFLSLQNDGRGPGVGIGCGP